MLSERYWILTYRLKKKVFTHIRHSDRPHAISEISNTELGINLSRLARSVHFISSIKLRQYRIKVSTLHQWQQTLLLPICTHFCCGCLFPIGIHFLPAIFTLTPSPNVALIFCIYFLWKFPLAEEPDQLALFFLSCRN